MKKKRRDPLAQKAKPTEPGGFRPLRAPLEALIEESRKPVAKEPPAPGGPAGKARATGGGALRATKGASTHRSPDAAAHATRESTLTHEERRDLDQMARDDRRDDELFFRRSMSGVVPLGADNRGRLTTAPEVKPRAPTPPAPLAPDPEQEVRDRLMDLVEGATRFEVSDDGRRLEGRRLDLDMAVMRRVRRGQLPIDARVDLHGKNAGEAKGALEEFLSEKRARRDRLVLVIHGRGGHSPAGIGVLRGEISAWLSQGRASRHVAAFATALPDDGGEGALYVLLRP